MTKPAFPLTRIDLLNIPDADLGRMMKEAIRATLAEPMPERREVALAEREADEAVQVAGIREARKTLVAQGTLPGFSLKGVDVPALEVSDVANLDETPASKARSPYNKLRARHGEPLLAYKDEPGVTACTWRDLIDDHERFSLMAGEPTEPTQPEPVVEPVVEPTAKIAATVDVNEKAAIKALMKHRGMTKAEAKRALAGVLG